MDSSNRRQFLRQAATGLFGLGAPAALLASRAAHAASHPAWSGPIGLELYTVRHLFAHRPLPTLRAVHAAGYQLVEGDVTQMPAPWQTIRRYLRESGLGMVSTLAMQPNPGTPQQWEILMTQADPYHLRYFVTMNTSVHDAEGWKRIAARYNEAGKIAKKHGLQFCYHNHITEFIPTGGTTGYEILHRETDPELLQFEMDVFWITYAQQDPVAWFKRSPGRYPLLHIKDMKHHVPAAYNPHQFPRGFDPFTEVGRGKINWARVFAHAPMAGVKHIFVEQDQTAPLSPLTAIKISYRYLRHLRVR